jgi:hypothetical protein
MLALGREIEQNESKAFIEVTWPQGQGEFGEIQLLPLWVARASALELSHLCQGTL